MRRLLVVLTTVASMLSLKVVAEANTGVGVVEHPAVSMGRIWISYTRYKSKTTSVIKHCRAAGVDMSAGETKNKQIDSEIETKFNRLVALLKQERIGDGTQPTETILDQLQEKIRAQSEQAYVEVYGKWSPEEKVERCNKFNALLQEEVGGYRFYGLALYDELMKY